jgi:hypothetical protein
LNAVSRFEVTRLKRARTMPKYAQPALIAAGGVIALLLMFQLFFRYQYMEANGVTWRIDRLTQQTCQLDIGLARCESSAQFSARRNSSSTSTSTSTSTSLSLKPGLAKKHKP